MSSCQVVVWVHSFIKQGSFDNNVLFDNTTRIYLINLLWKLGFGLGLDLRVVLFSYFLDLRVVIFSFFSWRITKTSTIIFRKFYVR